MERHYADEHQVLVEKIEDLASSLHATTGVLSAADQMLNQYRDANQSQEREISRLAAQSPHGHAQPETSTPYYQHQPGKSSSRKRAGYVRFNKSRRRKSSSSSDSEDLGGILNRMNKTQEQIRREISRDQRKRSEELESIYSVLKNDITASPRNDVHEQLTELQNQLRKDQSLHHSYNRGIDHLGNEIKDLKESVREAVEGRGSQEPSRLTSFVKELTNDRESRTRDQRMVSDLKRIIQDKDGESLQMANEIQQLKSEAIHAERQRESLISTLDNVRSQLDREYQQRQRLETQLQQLSLKLDAEEQSGLSLKRLSQTDKEWTAKYIRLKEDYNHLNEQLADATYQLEKKNSALRSTSFKMDEIARENSKEQQKLIDQLDATSKQLHSAITELSNTKATLKQRERELVDQQNQMGEARVLATIKEYRDKCLYLESNLKSLEDDNIDKASKISRLEVMLQAQKRREEDYIQLKNSKINDDQDRIVAALQRELKAKDIHLNDMQTEYASLGQELERSATDIRRFNKRSLHEQQQILNLEEKITEKDAELAKGSGRMSVLERELRRTQENALLGREKFQSSLACMLEEINATNENTAGTRKFDVDVESASGTLQDPESLITAIREAVRCRISDAKLNQETVTSLQQSKQAIEGENKELAQEIASLKMKNTSMLQHLAKCMQLLEQGCASYDYNKLLQHLGGVHEEHLQSLNATGNCSQDQTQLDCLKLQLQDAVLSHSADKEDRLNSMELTASLLKGGIDESLISNDQEEQFTRQHSRHHGSSTIHKTSSVRPSRLDHSSNSRQSISSRPMPINTLIHSRANSSKHLHLVNEQPR